MARHWIRAAANPLDLKVTKRAAGALGIHVAQAAGHLLALWSWLSQKTETGDVTQFTDKELEDGAGWTGPEGQFAAFVRTKHVDHRGRIRDWDEYMGPLMSARKQARDRQRHRRQQMRVAADTEVDQRLGRIPVEPPDESLCAYCEKSPAFCWDHVTPISLGGKHERKNIVPACNVCNAWKLDGPVTAILCKYGKTTEQQQNAWAEKYGVPEALEFARESFPHDESTFPHRGRHRRGGGGNNGTHLSREQKDNSPNQSKNHENQSTEVVLRKELSTTGRYLSTELDLVRSEGLDEKALSVSTQKNRDASRLTGLALVRAWSRAFYLGDPNAMLDALKRLRAVLRPAGVMFKGQMIRSTPALVVAAMNETLESPPDNPKAAIVVVLAKLTSGHLHEIRTETGVLVTDAEANEGRTIGRDITRNLLDQVPDLVASIGKPIPGRSVMTHEQKDRTLRELLKTSHAPRTDDTGQTFS